MISFFSKNKETLDLFKELECNHCEVMKVLNEFAPNKEVGSISYDDLMKFPLGQWVYLDDAKLVKIRRRKMRFQNYLNFDTWMDEGGAFGDHLHPDLIESCEVMIGEMIDLKDNQIYKEGDVMHYEKGEQHTPVCTKDGTRLNVLFKK